jgi:3-phosphoshikimate 1-carboxyvinyltransferase
MSNQLLINNITDKFDAEVNLPGSKSESNRALMIAAYGGFHLRSRGLSEAADTVLLDQNLEQIQTCSESSISSVIDCHNAGTVFRFLATYLAGMPGNWMLTGSYRMKVRPIGSLVDALQSLGADIRYSDQEGLPPLIIQGSKLKGGKLSISMSESSQFASSLLMAAPGWENGLELQLKGKLSSMPYLELTMEIMRFFGAHVEFNGKAVKVLPGTYQDHNFSVTRDWSGASYWYELVALGTYAELFLKELRLDSMQGDRVLADMFRYLGVETHQQAGGVRLVRMGKAEKKVEFDFTHCPDLLPAVAATCCGLGVQAVFKGLSNLKYKESDRTAAVEAELGKLGCKLEAVNDDVYKLHAPSAIENFTPVFRTYGDHRMAMALAPLSMKTGSAIIEDPDVVVKSYPGFWTELKSTGAISIE